MASEEGESEGSAVQKRKLVMATRAESVLLSFRSTASNGPSHESDGIDDKEEQELLLQETKDLMERDLPKFVKSDIHSAIELTGQTLLFLLLSVCCLIFFFTSGLRSSGGSL